MITMTPFVVILPRRCSICLGRIWPFTIAFHDDAWVYCLKDRPR